VSGPRPSLLLGLGLTTLATLELEVLDTRLLSVLTWYHLAFLCVSVAMLGMAAGAVLVFLGGEGFRGRAAPRTLVRWSAAFALSVPISHVANLVIPIPVLDSLDADGLAAIGVATAVLAAPFFFSGVVVTIALTRVAPEIGLLYGFDLLGAALGALLVAPLLDAFDLPSLAIGVGAVAALGAFCFARHAGRRGRREAVLAGALLAAAVWNGVADGGIGVQYAKGGRLPAGRIDFERWNSHSYVVGMRAAMGSPPYWGPGRGAERFRVESIRLAIDGHAGTAITRWDGRPESLEWARYDVTSLPYHLRRGGDVAVVGVGGGRDILAALWADSRSVVGIEVNQVFLDLLRGERREFARLADHPAVKLVHDEARSYLTRTTERFDVIQMSLIDTWAATGAGAFALSENALYTREAWRVFLEHLKPTGVFSVSRWFAPDQVSETSRLLALAVASLLERGVESPRRHVVLVHRGNLATLMVSPSPFSAEDLATVRRVSARQGFEPLALPGRGAADPQLERILGSRSPAALAAATADPNFDYTPPTDDRPYFFNLLKPGSVQLFTRWAEADGIQGVLAGNMRATATLLALFLVASALVAAIIGVPLGLTGRPRMRWGTFGLSLLYFGLIGLGFMLIQVPFLQRFSVFLGHPTYTFSVILATMILFAGLGSMLSDRFAIEGRAVLWASPLAIAASVVGLTLVLPTLLEVGRPLRLPGRCSVVVACVAPISLLLGLCFPFGMRLVRRVSEDAAAWMWGVNGAASVLASIVAVGLSMWSGIDTTLRLAAALYASLAIVAWRLDRSVRAGEAREDAEVRGFRRSRARAAARSAAR
jgi:hypothetical protein